MAKLNTISTLNLPSFEEGCKQEIIGTKEYTNVFLFEDDKILLGLKKRGFGKGKWNGFGGKIEVGETIIEGAKREMKEEACISIKSMEKIGELKFVFSQRNIALIVHIFKANGYEGVVSETEEMLPKWFKGNIESIPFKEMWSDDCYWFPYIIEGTPFKGAFYLDGNDEATLLAATLDTLKTNSF